MTDPWSAPPRPDLLVRPDWAGTAGTWAAAASDGPQKRRSGRAAVAVLTAVAIVAAALWFVLLRPSGPSGPAVALAVTFPKGQDVGYRVSVSMDGTVSVGGRSVDVSMSMTGRMKVHAVSVDATGVTKVRLSATRLTATVNGKTETSRGQSSVVRIARDGRVLGDGSLIPSGDSPVNMLPGSGELASLPDHPVHVGETWTKEFELPFPLGEGTARFSSSSKLAGYHVVDGVRSAVVESQAEVSLDSIEVKLRRLLGSSGGSGQLPPGVDPVVGLGGSLQIYVTDWLDTSRDLLLKQEGSGPFHMAMTLKGVPEGQGVPGEIDFDGRMSMAMERVA